MSTVDTKASGKTSFVNVIGSGQASPSHEAGRMHHLTRYLSGVRMLYVCQRLRMDYRSGLVLLPGANGCV